jgi:hypothetical protein
MWTKRLYVTNAIALPTSPEIVGHKLTLVDHNLEDHQSNVSTMVIMDTLQSIVDIKNLSKMVDHPQKQKESSRKNFMRTRMSSITHS